MSYFHFLIKGVFLVLREEKIVSMIVIMTGMFTLILLTSKIPPGRFFLGLELLLALIGLIFIVSKIVEAEREIKRITGHYQLLPPSGIYD